MLRIDPTHDLLALSSSPLDTFFSPRSVAVIGATDRPGSVGHTIFHNLKSAYQGRLFAVNPNRTEVLGYPAYPHIAALPGPVDLAVIVAPALIVPNLVKECVAAGVPAAVIISAGFKEIGAEGKAREQEIFALAAGTMRIIGPNCLGIMHPRIGLNATFAKTIANPGNIAFLSQSGALCTGILDWSLKEHVGFSAFVSIGSMVDIGWGDLIDHFGSDPETKSILIYMESIGDAAAFLSAAREVARTKPIIVLKAGRTEAASKAAASHTGAMTGSDEVLDAAFRRAGVLRVNDIRSLFNMAEILSKQPRPRGPRLAIVTNAGGPAVLTTDRLILQGGSLATLQPKTIDALNQFLPPHWSHANPVDILGDANAATYAKAVEIVAQDANTDGLLISLAPQAMTDPTETARRMVNIPTYGKPIFASWMGESDVAVGQGILNAAGIPTFGYPDEAAEVFNLMWGYSESLKLLYETPTLATDATSAEAMQRARRLCAEIRTSGRTLLTEVEAKHVMATWGLPVVPTEAATTADEAVHTATAMGFPVVLKLLSHTITHKTDVGGVILNLPDAASVRTAFTTLRANVEQRAGLEHFQGVSVQPMIRRTGYEIILGSSVDHDFGPVLLFGAGGELVEIYRDTALGLPPLNSTLARRLMERTKIFRALQGVRGRPPADLAALEQVLVQFSHLVASEPWIKEIDCNPLIVSPDGVMMLDARIVLHPAHIADEALPRPVIRPYPAQYATHRQLRDGTPITVRPIRPEDEPRMVTFHETLSQRSVYHRYFESLDLAKRTAHERLTRVCFIDYQREMVLVAEQEDVGHNIIGVARLTRTPHLNQAEFAMLVSDPFQGKGVGTMLLTHLLEIGRAEKIQRIVGEMLADNSGMVHLAQKLGFDIRRNPQDNTIVQAVREFSLSS